MEAMTEKFTAAKTGRKILRLLYFIKHRQRLQEYKVMSVLRYCRKNHIGIHYIEKEAEREAVVYPPVNGIREEKTKKCVIPVYPLYVTELEHAVITGWNDSIIVKHAVLNDRKDYIAENTFAPCPYYSLSIDKTRNYMMAKPLSIQRHIEKALCLTGRFPDNWWHYTYELLSRIPLFDMNSQYHKWPILIDDAAVKDESSFKLLKRLNVRNHPLITVKRNEQVHVKRLAYASNTVTEIIGDYAVQFDRNIPLKQTYLFINRSSIAYIRKCVLKSGSSHPSRKIFVARARKGRLLNEKEIADFFQGIGFEVLYSDRLSFEEEVEAFSNASVIVSTMGGAMANLTYVSSGSRVVCIFPHKAIASMSMYQEVADIIGFTFYNQDARIVKEGRTYDVMEYILPVDDCVQLCKNLQLI